MNCWAVVVAAGRGLRAGLPINKALYPLGGRSVLRRSLDALAACGLIQGAVLVISPQDRKAYRALVAREGESPLVRAVVEGGETRQQSVYNGLLALPPQVELAAIHDAARALVPEVVVRRAVLDAQEFGSGVAASAVTDTVKQVDALGRAVKTLDRDALRTVQTPQVFRREEILRAHQQALAEGYSATDDAALMERYFGPVHLSLCGAGQDNPKLTAQEDIGRMEGMLYRKMRVGHGFDAHRLEAGRALVLCGVTVPWDKGLAGHSDADVAVHALMDALLGAAGLGDIGGMFPDTDPATQGISSMALLKEVTARLEREGFEPLNCDVTIVAQRPKLAPYIGQMRDNVAQALGLDRTSVNVKATTTEAMGYEGRGEGISAHAVALIGGKDPCSL